MWQTGNTASKMLIENYRRFIMAQYQHTEWNPSVWSLHSVHISTQHIICSVLSVPDEDNCHVDGILGLDIFRRGMYMHTIWEDWFEFCHMYHVS